MEYDRIVTMNTPETNRCSKINIAFYMYTMTLFVRQWKNIYLFFMVAGDKRARIIKCSGASNRIICMPRCHKYATLMRNSVLRDGTQMLFYMPHNAAENITACIYEVNEPCKYVQCKCIARILCWWPRHREEYAFDVSAWWLMHVCKTLLLLYSASRSLPGLAAHRSGLGIFVYVLDIGWVSRVNISIDARSWWSCLFCLDIVTIFHE